MNFIKVCVDDRNEVRTVPVLQTEYINADIVKSIRLEREQYDNTFIWSIRIQTKGLVPETFVYDEYFDEQTAKDELIKLMDRLL